MCDARMRRFVLKGWSRSEQIINPNKQRQVFFVKKEDWYKNNWTERLPYDVSLSISPLSSHSFTWHITTVSQITWTCGQCSRKSPGRPPQGRFCPWSAPERSSWRRSCGGRGGGEGGAEVEADRATGSHTCKHACTHRCSHRATAIDTGTRQAHSHTDFCLLVCACMSMCTWVSLCDCASTTKIVLMFVGKQ